MPSIIEVATAPKDKRAGYLLKGRHWGISMFAALLFSYGVLAFKQNPTKKKAIFLWNTFLRDGLSTVSALDMDINSVDLVPGDVTRETLVVIQSSIALCEQLAATAARMNRVSRFLTSGDRGVPPTIFDIAIAQMTKSGGVLQEVAYDAFHVVKKPRELGSERSLQRAIPGLMKGFKDAGFSLADVGLG
jgi:hypothetical protein